MLTKFVWTRWYPAKARKISLYTIMGFVCWSRFFYLHKLCPIFFFTYFFFNWNKKQLAEYLESWGQKLKSKIKLIIHECRLSSFYFCLRILDTPWLLIFFLWKYVTTWILAHFETVYTTKLCCVSLWGVA